MWQQPWQQSDSNNSDQEGFDWGTVAQQWLKNKEFYEQWQQQQYQQQMQMMAAAHQAAMSTCIDPSVVNNPPPPPPEPDGNENGSSNSASASSLSYKGSTDADFHSTSSFNFNDPATADLKSKSLKSRFTSNTLIKSHLNETNNKQSGSGSALFVAYDNSKVNTFCSFRNTELIQ